MPKENPIIKEVSSNIKCNQKLNFTMKISESATVDNEFIINGTAINAVTTRNGHTFLAEELQPSAKSLCDKPLLKDHTNTIDSIVGKVKTAFYDPVTESIKFTAKIINETIKTMIKDNLITAVSVGAHVKSIEEGSDGNVICRGIEFVELSLVAVPADPGAGFEMAIMQSLSLGNDVKTLEQSKGIPVVEIKQEKMVETKVEEKTVVDNSKIEKMLEGLAEQNRVLTEKLAKMEESKKVEEEVKVNATKGKIAISEEVEKKFDSFVLAKGDTKGYAFYCEDFSDNKILGRGSK